MSAAEPERSPPPLLPLRRALGEVRAAAALAPARPAYAAGLRAAIATVAPLAASYFLGLGGGTWMSLAGFNGALADKGGPYRIRAATLGALTLAGAATAALGVVGAFHPAIAIPLTFVVAVACSLARAYGTRARDKSTGEYLITRDNVDDDHTKGLYDAATQARRVMETPRYPKRAGASP